MELVEERHDTCSPYASHGVGTAGVTLGSIGTALGALNLLNGNMSGLTGLIGGQGMNNAAFGALAGAAGAGLIGRNNWTGADRGVCRHDLEKTIEYEKELVDKNLEIAQLNTDNKMLLSEKYTDKKMIEVYESLKREINVLNQKVAAQDVMNQANKDSFQIVQERIDASNGRMRELIDAEAHERKCSDNTIVNYVNATFYPKMVADVTTGTTTTAQRTYNPLPVCNCNNY